MATIRLGGIGGGGGGSGIARTGRAVFPSSPGSTFVAVVFGVAFNDTSYSLTFEPTENVNTWYSDKTAAGFTLHVSDILIDKIVDWIALHD